MKISKKWLSAILSSAILISSSFVCVSVVNASTESAKNIKAIDLGNCNGDSVLDICDLVTLSESSDATTGIDVDGLKKKLLNWDVESTPFTTTVVENPSVKAETFKELKYRSLSKNTHLSVGTEGTDKILTFNRKYTDEELSKIPWAGGGIQLRTDDGEYYKLKPSTSYQVKFDYRVESYSEASDKEFKDLSLMVAVSEDEEGTFTNARSVTARDLDAVTFAHKANEPATSGDYAAVGAKIKAGEVDNNWHSVTAEFTTKETLTTTSGTFDNLTLSIISNKPNAGDIKVSFKNISIAPDDSKHIDSVSSTGSNKANKANDTGDWNRTMYTYSGYSVNDPYAYGFFELKNNSNVYTLQSSNTYRVRLSYKIDDCTLANNDKIRIALMAYSGQNWTGTIKDVSTGTKNTVTSLSDLFTAIDKNDENSKLIPQITATAVSDGWKDFDMEFTTKESLQYGTGANAYTADKLGIMVFAGDLKGSTSKTGTKVSFKNISVENVTEKDDNAIIATPSADGKNVTFAFNTYNNKDGKVYWKGNCCAVSETGFYIGTAAGNFKGTDNMMDIYITEPAKFESPNANYLVNTVSDTFTMPESGYIYLKGYISVNGSKEYTDTYIYDIAEKKLSKMS